LQTIAEIMGSEQMDFKFAKRYVNWLANLVGMPEHRQPRKLLFAWPQGGKVRIPNPLLQ
jgi:hypothetical protein